MWSSRFPVTHRVAISNHRLVSFADGKVTFRWRDSAHNNEQKLMTLSLDEFLRRFLLHLLLPQVWWADDGRRKTPSRNPTSFSTDGHGCSMKRLSPIRILRVFSTRSVPLRLAAERSSFSSLFNQALHDPFSQQPAFALIKSRVALCRTAWAQLDAAPSYH